jgi:pyridoxamine 5'-phosphate oxidase
LKSFSKLGFVFYTNYKSRKAQAMAENPQVAANFLWLPLQRQVSLVGRVQKISRSQSAAYFSSRPRSSQIGAWVSPQSQSLSTRAELEALQQEVEAGFADAPIPIPEHWGGYAIVPHSIEFWQGRPSRLHDRFIYTQSADTSTWKALRLAP